MNLAVTATFLLLLFGATFVFAKKVNNFGVVDVVWSLAFAPVAAYYALANDGWLPRRLVAAALFALWSLRLGTYLWSRVASHHPAEDPRYAVLRQRWGTGPKVFLPFFLGQGVLVWLLTLPLYLLTKHTGPTIAPLEIAGAAIIALALAGEALADHQLKRFKAASDKPVCTRGLWRYSRHPNYFFQCLLWIGVATAAFPAPNGWTSIAAPIAMIYFILKVTGIPLTEELAVARKGEPYKAYQRTTSPLIPLPPKD